LTRKYNNGSWTEAKFNSFITSILRAGSRRWPPKYEALRDARTDKHINVKSGRVAQHFKCNHCGGDFPATEVQVDHIIPMGKGRTWDDWINELFCETDNLQVLCKPCHAIKTKEEKKNNVI